MSSPHCLQLLSEGDAPAGAEHGIAVKMVPANQHVDAA